MIRALSSAGAPGGRWFSETYGRGPYRNGARVPGRRTAAVATLAVLLLGAAPRAGPGQETDSVPEATVEESARYGAFTYLKRPVEESGSVMTILITPDVRSTLESGTRLFVRCLASKAGVYVSSTDEALAPSGESVRGQFRFDDSRWSQLAGWPSAEGGQAVFVPGGVLGRFIQRAAEAERLYVQFAGSRGSFQQFVFSLEGFSDGIGRLPCFRAALPTPRASGRS